MLVLSIIKPNSCDESKAIMITLNGYYLANSIEIVTCTTLNFAAEATEHLATAVGGNHFNAEWARICRLNGIILCDSNS